MFTARHELSLNKTDYVSCFVIMRRYHYDASEYLESVKQKMATACNLYSA
jgi:hypothetical protein